MRRCEDRLSARDTQSDIETARVVQVSDDDVDVGTCGNIEYVHESAQTIVEVKSQAAIE